VRGAIDTALVAGSLAQLRSVDVVDQDTGLDAALVALSGRMRMREGSTTTAEDVVRALWAEVFGSSPPPTKPGKSNAPDGRRG
jgi:MoxR-like ATPase